MSNLPESITAEGLLYEKREVTGSARLVVFHKNAYKNPGYLTVRITISENQVMQYRESISTPMKSEMWVGQHIATRYLEEEPKFDGFKGEWSRDVYLSTEDVYGSMMDLYPPVNGTFNVFVFFSTYQLSHDFIPRPPKRTSLKFPYSDIEQRVTIKDDGRRNNLKLGQPPYLKNDNDVLHGNYGVMHRYYLRFKKAGIYGIYFTANGGPARYVFRLDGKQYQGYAYADKKIETLSIPYPRELCLETFPLSGSNYPVTITIIKQSP